VLPFVRQRESAGQALFLNDLRPTTALFVRFSGLDYDQDAEAAAALDGLVCQAQLVLQRHGGVLLELNVGDKGSYLYGSFGAAQVHEDDVFRALRAAVELRQHVETLPISVQMGLSSGTMRVGGYGGSTRQSFGATGDDVNLAARLMSAAAPGELLVSARVRQAVGSEFTFEARPPVRMKGKAEPLLVFAVSGLDERRAMRLQEPAYALPMIGRDAELALLREGLSAVVQGRGKVIAISAEAGMGKSRLVAEGVRLARRSELLGYGGSCPPEDLQTPYRVWRSIWSAFFDLDPTLPLRRQTRAIEAELADRVPLHTDAMPVLGPVLGLPLPDNNFTRGLQPEDRKSLLETILIGCLESAAREAATDGRGLLLVLEDLHWVDPLSLDLLVLVARAIEQLPVMLLLTFRPTQGEGHELPVARLQGLRHFSRVPLNALDAPQSELVIRARLAQLFPERTGAVPAVLIDRITQRAQGNPFYLEELLNYLHDRGIDPRHAAASQALDLPTSLYSLILSRIDRLEVSQQLALKVASVIGRVFRVSHLKTLHPSPGNDDDLLMALRELDRLDFTPLELPEPELTYLFKHLVTLEVSYQNIAHATRVELHGRFARFLDSLPPQRLESLAPQLAHHYLQAQIPDRAAHYLQKAGDAAAAGFANQEALDYYARALQLTPSDDAQARYDTLLKTEALHDMLGQHDQRREVLAALSGLAALVADPVHSQALVATRLSRLEIDVGDYAAALANARVAIDAIDAAEATRAGPGASGPAAALLVDALLLEARANFFAGRVGAVRPGLERASALARAHGYARGAYNALAQEGALDWHAGAYEAAETHWSAALALIRQAGDIRREIDILNNLGVVARAQSRFAAAVDHFEQAQRAARKIGDRSGEATLYINLSSASLASADYTAAGQYAEEAARIFAEVREPLHHGSALTNRAEAYRELGQYGLASASAQEALALLRTSGYRRGEAIVLWNIGLIEFALGQFDRALQTTTDAMALAREIGARTTEASTHLHLGLIHTTAGRLVDAQQALDAAQALVGDLRDELLHAELLGARARLALAQGSTEGHSQAMASVSRLLPMMAAQAPGAPIRVLPMALYLVACRALVACADPRADALIEQARAELHQRAARIADAAVRRRYLEVAEHRAILAPFGGQDHG
jgi:tetratricopeptide (TPR) repeat protein